MATKVVPGVALLPQINIITLNPKLVEAAKRVRVYVRSMVAGVELDRVVLWNFSHLDPPVSALLYAFTVGDGNPELVMSIWENADGTFSAEFGSQTGGDLNVYVDGTEKGIILGGSPGYFSIILP